MTYNTLYGQSPTQYQPVSGSVSALFHPGFAGTNVQEVRALNAGHSATTVLPTYSVAGWSAPVSPTYPVTGLSAPVSSVYSPGFAGTNVQEVRALNAGYPAPAIHQQAYGVGQAPVSVNPAFTSTITGPSAVNSIFSPGFAGTDVNEVRARNAGAINVAPLSTNLSMAGGVAGGINSIFSPGFAGTNIQEVRALNAGYPAPAAVQQPLTTGYAATGVTPGYPSGMGAGSINAIFQPGFAGTNAQEVRSDYAPSQQSAAPYGVGYTHAVPYRTI